MASVSNVSSSNTNALYGSRNVLSGLASGMDTESMIENSISGLRLKISGLQQKQTKLEWKQTAYQGLTDKMVQFTRKYTSYTSSTNLLSPSFFNKAVTTTTNGANASKVSATGKTSSTVAVNGVAQLAAASRYEVASGQGILATVGNASGQRIIKATSAVDLAGEVDKSNVSGTISLNYGNQEISISLDETVYEDLNAFKTAIVEKLKGQSVSYSSGSAVTADQAINVAVSDGKIVFSDKKSNNEVYISGLSGTINQTFSDDTFDSTTKVSSLDFSGSKTLSQKVSLAETLADQEFTFTLDGVQKTITMPSLSELSDLTPQELIDNHLQTQLTSAFGTKNGTPRVTVGNASGDPTKLQLTLTVAQGSSLTMASSSNQALSLDATATSYLNTSKTLGNLLAENTSISWDEDLKAVGTVTQKGSGTSATYWDSQGNRVAQIEGKDGYYLVNEAGTTPLKGHTLSINGVTIGNYTKDTALETVLRDINNNVEAGVSVSYSTMSNQFVFTAKDTGSAYGIKNEAGKRIGDDTLGAALFGSFQASKFTEGKDAIVNLDVNGSNLTISRSSNTFDVDGLSVTISGTFNGTMEDGEADFDFMDESDSIDRSLLTDPVTFTTTADADKIVAAVKSMVEDYNTMLTELREAFNTVPAQKSDGSKYEPLTESDQESMSDTAIANYEEKAKQGILFADQDLSSMYNSLLKAISPGGTDGVTLRSMGISTGYYQGLTTIEFDETKFRETLSTDPDSVRDAFTKVAGDGSSTNGIMTSMQNTLKAYASVEGTKGILINKAGSKYSASSLLQNSLKDEIDDYSDLITKWQDKMSDKIDYYTRQYSRLESLISEMNSQSSSLSGLTGS